MERGAGGHFRFQDLKVWQHAIDLSDKLFDIADGLMEKKLYRFADQLRGVGSGISNNIAEGSGSTTSKEFARYLTISRSSVFEGANILFMLHRRGLLDEEQRNGLLESCEHLARKVSRLRTGLQA